MPVPLCRQQSRAVSWGWAGLTGTGTACQAAASYRSALWHWWKQASSSYGLHFTTILNMNLQLNWCLSTLENSQLENVFRLGEVSSKQGNRNCSLLWLGTCCLSGKGGDGDEEGKLCLIPTTEAWLGCLGLGV